MKIRILIIFVLLFLSTNILFGQTGQFTLRGKITDSSSPEFIITNCRIYIYSDSNLLYRVNTDFEGKYQCSQLNPSLSKSLNIKLKYFDKNGVDREIDVSKKHLATVKEQIRSDVYVEFNYDVADSLSNFKNEIIKKSSVVQLPESPNIKYPFQKVNVELESTTKAKNKSILKIAFTEGGEKAIDKLSDRIETRSRNRKYKKENKKRSRIYPIDKYYSLYTTLKDSLVQNNPNANRILVFFLSKSTKKTIFPFIKEKNDPFTNFRKTDAEFSFGRDINTFYYKGKPVDIAPSSDIYIVHRYECEKPLNFSNPNHSSFYYYDYIWTTNFKEYYSKDKLVLKLDRKDTTIEFISNSNYFKIANTTYNFDDETQSVQQIDSISLNSHAIGNFLCDSIQCYYKNNRITFQNEPITHVYSNYFKTSTSLLKYNYHRYIFHKDDFKELLKVNGHSLIYVQGQFMKDQNDVYFEGKPVHIPKSNINKVTFFENSLFYTDSQYIYFEDKRLNQDFSSFTFISDECFSDKNGIYQLNLSKKYRMDSISLIPFHYSFPFIKDSVYIFKNASSGENRRYVKYNNQLFDCSTNSFYYDIPHELLKMETFNIFDLSPYVDSNSHFNYNHCLFKYRNKLYYYDKFCNVDAKTFKALYYPSNRTKYFVDKDKVYLYEVSKGFVVLDSIEPKKFRQYNPIRGLMQDDNFIYFENNKILNIQNIISVDYIEYSRPDRQPPGCGMDKSNHYYESSYIVTTNEGSWLLNYINSFDYQYNCDRQSVEYRKLSKDELQHIHSLQDKKTITLKRN